MGLRSQLEPLMATNEYRDLHLNIDLKAKSKFTRYVNTIRAAASKVKAYRLIGNLCVFCFHVEPKPLIGFLC